MTKSKALKIAQTLFGKYATVREARMDSGETEYRIGQIKGLEMGFPMNMIKGSGATWEEALEKAKLAIS